MCCYRYYTYSTNDVDGAFNYRWNVWHGDHSFNGSETGQNVNKTFEVSPYIITNILVNKFYNQKKHFFNFRFTLGALDLFHQFINSSKHT